MQWFKLYNIIGPSLCPCWQEEKRPLNHSASGNIFLSVLNKMNGEHFAARLKLLCLFHSNETLRKRQPLWAEMHLSSSTHPQQILPLRRHKHPRHQHLVMGPISKLFPISEVVSTFDPENAHFFAPLWLWTWHWHFHYLLIANHSAALFWPVSWSSLTLNTSRIGGFSISQNLFGLSDPNFASCTWFELCWTDCLLQETYDYDFMNTYGFLQWVICWHN